MSALSIRRMNFTLQALEHIEAQKQTAWYASLPAEERAVRSHYWFIERKAKRGNKWIFVRDLQATKREAAELFVKHFRNSERSFRLRRLLSY